MLLTEIFANIFYNYKGTTKKYLLAFLPKERFVK
jgi:hypothetical protein